MKRFCACGSFVFMVVVGSLLLAWSVVSMALWVIVLYSWGTHE